MNELPTAQPSTLAEQLSLVSNLWDVSCVLLRHWQAAIPEQPACDSADERWDRWSQLCGAAAARFETAREFSADDRAYVLEKTAHGTEADAVHALVSGLTYAAQRQIYAAWRSHAKGSDGCVRLETGDLYPVLDSPWARSPISARPSSLSGPAHHELPHLRVHSGDFDVCIDFTFEDSLSAIMALLTCFAALHPNEEWGEIEFAPGDAAPVSDPVLAHQYFPIRPRDCDTQGRLLTDLVDQALESSATLSIIPELALCEAHVQQLARRFSTIEDVHHLLIAGSVHVAGGAGRENLAYGLIAGRKDTMVHRKTTPATFGMRKSRSGDHPRKEGIPRYDRLQFTVYQADAFRIATPICKEFLEERMTRALDRVGANTLLVPSLSPSAAPYVLAAGERVNRAQALSLVVNGPLRGPDGAAIEPPIVVGQPISRIECVETPVESNAPTITVVPIPAIASTVDAASGRAEPD